MRTADGRILCPSCMKENEENAINCIACGSPINITNKEFQLAPGTVIGQRYMLGSVIGQGGFGITYMGWDMRLNKRVAIKEYFPVGIVDRRSSEATGITVTAGNDSELFERQKKRFLEEAYILAKFSEEKSIVNISDIVTDNNTAYIVMAYIQGESLADYLKKRGKISFRDAYAMIRPIITTLQRVHESGLIHRDISPANIMMENDGSLILLDFGAAREFDGEGEKSLSVILKHGYAPVEQYFTHGEQGPWTDVYAICATLYRMITGKLPEDSLQRMESDTLKKPSELGAVISKDEEAALLKGLAIQRGKRFSSMEELDTAFQKSGGSAAARKERSRDASVDKTEILSETEKKRIIVNPNKKRRKIIILSAITAGALLIVLVVVLGVSALRNRDAGSKTVGSSSPVSTSTSKQVGKGETNWRGVDWTNRDDILPYMNDEGYMVFGAYEQDGDETNGPEPIEWEVLESNANGTFLVSRYLLDAQPYNEEDENVTWESCTLRSWLNGEFMNKAFTPAEQAVIKTVNVTNPDNPYYGTEGGNDTQDRIFLLSAEEVISHYSFNSWYEDFKYGYSMDLIISPTVYAEKHKGVMTSVITEDVYSVELVPENYSRDCIGRAGWWWWLRTPTSDSSHESIVNERGCAVWYTLGSHVDFGNGCVRPALYITE